MSSGRQHAQPVAVVAGDVGFGWHTIMRAVIDHGEDLVTTPPAPAMCTHALGLMRRSFLRAGLRRRARFVTVDVQPKGETRQSVVTDNS